MESYPLLRISVSTKLFMENFEVPSPPKCSRKLWDFSSAKLDAIRSEMGSVDWDLFQQGKNVNEMVDDFNSIFKNIIETNVPSRMTTIDDRDAPWINTIVKTALVRNKRVYKNWVKRGRPNGCLEYVKTVQKETKILINGAKYAHIDILSKKLCDPKIGQKEFWGAYKRIVNKNNNTNIPPILENGHFVTDFSDKAKIFNHYFAVQCRPLDMHSNLPALSKKCNNSLENIIFNSEMIVSIIKKLNATKSHGVDGISIKIRCYKFVGMKFHYHYLSYLTNALTQVYFLPNGSWPTYNLFIKREVGK